jgi:hypothetical protein
MGDVALEPDAKDWTWVITRACPECGFNPLAVQAKELPTTIRRDAASWAGALAATDARLRTRSDRWSTLEYGCHVRDALGIFDQRLALMLSEVDPTFANWDQDETARAGGYDLQDPTMVAGQLAAAAEVVARRYEEVQEDEWSRPGMRSNGSRFTVASLGTYLVHDVEHHLWDLTTL